MLLLAKYLNFRNSPLPALRYITFFGHFDNSKVKMSAFIGFEFELDEVQVGYYMDMLGY